MKALITGASSGIGYSIAKYMDSLGFELILVGRNKDNLEELQTKIKSKSKIVVVDLSDTNKVKDLYLLTRSEKIDILVNNAGFGLYGDFLSCDLNKEIEMINTNIKAVHLLTKLFLKDMKKRNSGYILNVASTAAFGPGPLMSTYYATKAYVNSLTESIAFELKQDNSNVIVSSLCPGPVKTNFNKNAGLKDLDGLDADYVAKYAVDNLLEGKILIIPGFKNKLGLFLRRLASRGLIRKITYKYQLNKNK